MRLTSEEQEIIKAVETLGRYYGFEYDHDRIVIYTNLIKDKITKELIFDRDILTLEESSKINKLLQNGTFVPFEEE